MMYLEVCTNEQLKELYAEFNTDEESLKRDAQHLMDWLEKQPHLPPFKDEYFLSNVLLQCKNSLEQAKKQLEAYYVARAKESGIFSNYDPFDLEVQKVRSMHSYVHLPKPTPDGQRIFIYRAFQRDENAKLPDPEDTLKLNAMELDLFFKNDRVRGVIMVYDLQNVNASHISLFVASIRKRITLTTKLQGFRISKIYLLNVSSSMETLLNFTKKVLSRKLSDRIEVWNRNVTDLAQVLPRDVLPSDYGGTERSIEELQDLWYRYVSSHREWFLFIEKMHADLNKLPKEALDGEANQMASEFGVEGSFRKICID